MENISEISSENLVKISGQHIIGTGGGAKVQEAQAELTRRLTDSIKDLEKSNNTYSDRMMELSILIFILTVIQIFISIGSVVKTVWQWVGGVIIAWLAIYFAIYQIKKYKTRRNKK